MTTTWSADRAAGTATVVVLGDSISAVPSPYCAWPNRWPDRLAWEWPTVNLARSGVMPQDLLANGNCILRASWYADWGAGVMARLPSLNPSLVIVALGAVNYGWIGQHPIDYMNNMRALCDSIRSLTPRSTITLVHTPGFMASHGQNWIWVDYGKGLDAYAASQPNMGYCDLARDLPWADSDTSGAFAPDRTHPSNAGQVMMAVGIVGRLRWL
jgi:lysophospholipase L1-like esterase